MFEHLRQLQATWKDEIPATIIQSINPDRKLKVRKGWFQGVIADVEELIEEGSISDPKKIKAGQELIEKFTSDEFNKRELITPEDIQTANGLIGIILGE